MKIQFVLYCFILITSVNAQDQKPDSLFIRKNYTKIERMIPMRDGVKLFTAIYIPIDDKNKYPVLMKRTPYSSEPYGEVNYPKELSSNPHLVLEKYIFVIQDVRGRYMSEGNFTELTPHLATKKSKKDVDESSDAFDTIEWLLKNIKNNNGKVGIYGMSYPGFYATASLPGAHIALKAVSPQGPITDEFAGDDVYHNGAFFLMDNFAFYSAFDFPRSAPGKKFPPVFDVNIVSSSFYRNVEPLSVAEDRYFKGRSKIWTELTTHHAYDEYWKARNIRAHLKGIKPAVLVVGGWFDAEVLFGALHTYEAAERLNSGNDCHLIMGPWTHGAWSQESWSSYANYDFGSNTTEKFKDMEAGFFNFHLKGKGTSGVPEATIFMTGSNEWKSFNSWPPKEAETVTMYLEDHEGLSFSPPSYESATDEYVSDPAKPVPYTNEITEGRWASSEFMGADQRFASSRPDVLTYQTDLLESDMTVVGPLDVSLYFSTTGTDADLIVKLIDVLPDDAPNPTPNPRGVVMPGMQMLVRGDVLRGKFRNSLEKPDPFIPEQPTSVSFTLNDIGHTFKKGHRIMVQIQSSWFPLVDLNPQKFMEILKATPADFQRAINKIYTGKKYPSRISARRLR